MPQSLLPINHHLVTEFGQRLEELTEICLDGQRRDGMDQAVFRADLRESFERIKELTIKMMQAGFSDALGQMEKLRTKLHDLGNKTNSIKAYEVFLDEMSNFFPPSINSCGWLKINISEDLKIKLGVLTIDQLPHPEIFPGNVLRRISNDRFMDALSTMLSHLIPPYRRFDIDIYDALDGLNGRLTDEAFHEQAIEHILAHQDLYFPILQRLIALVDREVSPKAPAQSDQQIETYVRDMLTLLDFSSSQIDDLYSTGDHYACVPKAETLKSIRRTLSFTASFLSKLYEASPHPLVKQLGEFAFKNPNGPMPYQHLERIGIIRSNEWHIEQQETRKDHHCLLLMEHAIHTPGIELSPKGLLEDNENFSNSSLNYAIKILKSVDIHDPECRRKAQVLFDAVVKRAVEIKPNPWIIEQIKKSSIHPKLFANHKQLRGELLENRLGL
jgi:hypothetical protein